MRRVWASVAAGVAFLMTLTLVAACGGAAPKPAAPIDRLTIGGASIYANGANLPWINYGNDIGGNAWGEYGFHDDKAQLDQDFGSMQEQGITTARVWLFADGRAGIEFDSAGLPTRLDPEVFSDLDALTGAASAHHLLLDLVLFDREFMGAAQPLGDGVESGGHGALISTGAGGRALEKVVVLPVLEHLRGSAAVFSIEAMNEPEPCLAQDGNLATACSAHPISLDTFNAWTRMVAGDVHRTDPGVLVTVGSASSHWVGQYQGDDLDYYEVHSYGTDYAPNLDRTRASRLGLDRPVVIGEYPAAGSTTAFSQQMAGWYGEGYAGAWVWSFRAVDEIGGYDAATMHTWNTAHAATRVQTK